MSFLQFTDNKLTYEKTIHSLRAYLASNRLAQKTLKGWLTFSKPTVYAAKRASFIICHEKKKASMTVEAAFAVPIFLFTIITILSSISMISIQSRMSAALHQTGNEMAFVAYPYSHSGMSAIPSEVRGVLLTELYAKTKITDYVGQRSIQSSGIKNGAAGISMVGSSIMGSNDVIKLQVTYVVSPIFPIVGFNEFAMSQKYYGRAWTGYDVEHMVSDTGIEDPMVYITQNGQVYHLDRGCTYLNPSISSVDVGMINGLRNRSGEKYYACELCGQNMGFAYITDYGNRYHSALNCSGLKRTIYTIPLSKVGGRGKCSKCG